MTGRVSNLLRPSHQKTLHDIFHSYNKVLALESPVTNEMGTNSADDFGSINGVIGKEEATAIAQEGYEEAAESLVAIL